MNRIEHNLIGLFKFTVMQLVFSLIYGYACILFGIKADTRIVEACHMIGFCLHMIVIYGMLPFYIVKGIRFLLSKMTPQQKQAALCTIVTGLVIKRVMQQNNTLQIK